MSVLHSVIFHLRISRVIVEVDHSVDGDVGLATKDIVHDGHSRACDNELMQILTQSFYLSLYSYHSVHP